MLVQFLGFFGAQFLGWWFDRNVGSLKIKKDENKGPWLISEAVGMEFCGSFVFILFQVLQQHKSTSVSANYGLNTFIIGTFYGALVVWGAPYTGGSFNPGYGLARTVVDSFDQHTVDSIRWVWIYVVLPFIAALFVWPVYELIYQVAYKDTNNKQTDVYKTAEA